MGYVSQLSAIIVSFYYYSAFYLYPRNGGGVTANFKFRQGKRGCEITYYNNWYEEELLCYGYRLAVATYVHIAQ